MKVEVEETKAFRPIELKITIESEQELWNLWHRMNVHTYYINKHSEGKFEAKIDDDKLWEVLDELRRKS